MKCFALFALTSLLVACQFKTSLPALLDAYVTDLNRYDGLNIELPDVRYPEFSLPDYSKKQQNLSQFDLGLLDFLSLQHCELGFLVGNKNSVLGKVMPNSQRFLYEVRVIRALNACEASSESLQRKLRQVAHIKRNELNMAYANAIFNSGETDVFYSLSNGYLPLSENQSDFNELNISLNVLAELGNLIAEKASAADIVETGLLVDFERHFKVMNDSEYAGRLLLTLMVLTDYFEVVSEALSELSLSSTFCQGPMLFLKQKFKQHYIEVLQPYMARVNGPAYDVLTHLSQMRLAAADSSPALDDFLQQFSMTNKEGAWLLYKAAVQKHAKSWDRLLRGCHVF